MHRRKTSFSEGINYLPYFNCYHPRRIVTDAHSSALKGNIVKIILTLATVLVSFSQAQAGPRSEKIKEAVEYLSACGNFVRVDDQNVYTGFGTYWTSDVKPRQPKPSILRFVPIDKISEYQVDTLDSVVDVVKHGTSTFVLTYSGLEEWDLNKYERIGTYATHTLGRELKDEEHPRGLAIFNNKLIIAHGRLGLTVFDLQRKKVTNVISTALSHRPLESMVNDVTISGHRAYAVVDSYSLVGPREKQPFRGFVVVDLQSERVIAEMDGLDPSDTIVADDKFVLVGSYGLPISKYAISNLQTSKLPPAIKRVWKFPLEGYQKGKGALDDKYYYTCFARMPKDGEGQFFVKIPMALDRQSLGLE